MVWIEIDEDLAEIVHLAEIDPITLALMKIEIAQVNEFGPFEDEDQALYYLDMMRSKNTLGLLSAIKFHVD